MPVSKLEEMEVLAQSPSEFGGKLLEKRHYPSVIIDVGFTGVASDLTKRNDETEGDGNDGDILGHLETIREPGKKGFIYGKKRSLRLLKRQESGDDKEYVEKQTGRRSGLDGRDASYRTRRDVSDAIDLAAEMLAREEACKKILEKVDQKRRKSEAGKRSADNAASNTEVSSKTETANWRNYDFGSNLLAALSDSRSK